MRPRVLLLFVIFLFPEKSFGQENKLKVCFTGDVMLDRAVEQKINNRGISFLSNPLHQLLNDYPYRLINLESPITTALNPIAKPYNFRVDTSFFELLKLAGITHAGIANNHINDQRHEGAVETIEGLHKNGISPFGYCIDEKNKCQPVEIVHHGIKVTIFAAMELGVSEDEKKNICSCNEELFQRIRQYKTKNEGTLVVCYLHWGVEYNHTPSENQRTMAHKLIDSGADIIIGHHPHVVQTIEFYKHKPIFYSLGNLVFDQHPPETKQGFVLGVSANGNSVECKVIPYSINDFRPVSMEHEVFEAFKEKLLRYSNGIELKQVEGGWLVNEKKAQGLESGNYSLKLCDANFCGNVSLEKLSQLAGYRLRIEDSITGQYDELHLKYPVYRFDCADIDGDGNTDIIAGVIKPTHFEPELDRRLFIFRIDSFQIRPLWLGSKLCQKLIDFRSMTDDNINQIISLEKTRNELYCIGIYKWQNFGLQLIEYKYSDLDYQTALNYFEHEK